MTNSTEIQAAINTLADFLGEDSLSFRMSMLERRNANTLAMFQTEAAKGNCEVVETESVTLRTSGARTEFDSRVLGMLGRRRGNEVSAATVIASMGVQFGTIPTGAQMRASLNRLIESGDVEFSGIQRGTKYSRA